MRRLSCSFLALALDVPRGSYPTPFLGRLLFKITDPNHKTRYPKTGVGYEPLGIQKSKLREQGKGALGLRFRRDRCHAGLRPTVVVRGSIPTGVSAILKALRLTQLDPKPCQTSIGTYLGPYANPYNIPLIVILIDPFKSNS